MNDPPIRVALAVADLLLDMKKFQIECLEKENVKLKEFAESVVILVKDIKEKLEEEDV